MIHTSLRLARKCCGLILFFTNCVLASAQVNFSVPGTVPNLQQPTRNTCWATAATILVSWKTNSSLSIQTVMQRADTNSSSAFGFANKFSNDQGLSGSLKPDFLKALGLKAEPPMNPTIAGWQNLLRNNGPLWVTTNEGTRQNFAIHARIMTAIAGDGSADGTFVTFIDPADGQVHSESMTTFVNKLEQVAQADLGNGAELRPQIVHF